MTTKKKKKQEKLAKAAQKPEERITYLYVDAKNLRIIFGTKYSRYFKFESLFGANSFLKSELLNYEQGGAILSRIVLPNDYDKGEFYSNLPSQARLYSLLSTNIKRSQQQAIEYFTPLTNPQEIEESILLFRNSIVQGTVELASRGDRARVLQMITDGKQGQSYNDLVRIVSLAKRCAVYNTVDLTASLSFRNSDHDLGLYSKPGIKIRPDWR